MVVYFSLIVTYERGRIVDNCAERLNLIYGHSSLNPGYTSEHRNEGRKVHPVCPVSYLGYVDGAKVSETLYFEGIRHSPDSYLEVF